MSARRSLGKNLTPVSPLLQSVLDHLDEGFLLIDPDDRVCLWNTAYCEMLDLPESLFAPGVPIMTMIRALADRGDYGPGDPAVIAPQVAARIRSRQPVTGERQMANGNIIAVEWLPIPDGYFLFRLRDVTSDRLASRFKDELISTVSHELRTPLTAIIGALGLLRGGTGEQLSAQARGLVDVACKNGDRLARLVNDLLDVDQLQSGALEFDFEPSDIGTLLAASVEQNLPYAQSLGSEIDLEVPTERLIADVDRNRLLQVMSNLLSNAAKFSPTGSRVRVLLARKAGWIRISVIDRGRGMSPEFCRRLFMRFAQENRASERGQAGTGLGLAICKNIIDRHRGQIHVDTREGVGTIFHVDLPPHERDAADSGAAQT